jgi:hypothetical protein
MGGKMNLYYDDEGDYLTIFVGESKPNYGADITKGVTIFKDEETDEVIGIGILDFRKRAKEIDEIELDLPFNVNFSALKV